MARPLHAKDVGLSLAKLVAHYGLGEKDQSALIATKGKHLCDFSADEISEMAVYNAADVDQCYGLLQHLCKQTDKAEIMLIDMTIRMLIEPQCSTPTRRLLVDTLADESARKQAMLARCGVQLMGAAAEDATLPTTKRAGKALTVLCVGMAKFAAVSANRRGRRPDESLAERTGKEIPALAKTDEAFLLSCKSIDNPLVAYGRIAARLDAKSTILTDTYPCRSWTRLTRIPVQKVPIPLKYYGADTTGRWSGWGYNPQNLPRINPYATDDRPTQSRKSLRAPAGLQGRRRRLVRDRATRQPLSCGK